MTQKEKNNFEKYLDEQWAKISKQSVSESACDRYYYLGLTQALRMSGYFVERRVDGVHFITVARPNDGIFKNSELEYPQNLISDILNETQSYRPTKLAVEKLYAELLNLKHPKKALILQYYKDKKPLLRISEDCMVPVSHVKRHIEDSVKELRRNNSLIRTLRGESVISSAPYVDNEAHYIENCELSQRVKNCLRRSGIEKLEDLSDKTWKQLFHIRGFGAMCQDELIPCLKKCGIKLKDEKEEFCEKENE